MNTKFRYLLVARSVLPAVLLFHVSCSDRPVANPVGQQSTLQSLPDHEKIIWRLVATEKSGRQADISSFPTFHLIFEETQFFGDDGCNWFGAPYETRSDSIFPGDLAQTLRLCDQATFPVEHLAKPFRLRLSGNELRLSVDDATYVYRSDVAENIQGSPLLGNWQLSNSTDPDFEAIQERQLIPMLSFGEDRQFNLVWYCVEENTFGCDEIAGLFGTGSGGKILFYQRESAYHGEETGANFMQRILGSSSYAVKPNSPKGATLTLFNKDNDRSYEFQAIRRDDSSDDTTSFSDTLKIAHKDTLFNADENIAITFDSLLSDSRCPVNVDCFWEGNAELGFVFVRDNQQAEFNLNTSPNFTTSVVRFNFEISLLDVSPAPHTDSTFVADDYIARIAIRKLE